jgi:hypothetical protein
MAIPGIGQLTQADEGFHHQIADTFATVVAFVVVSGLSGEDRRTAEHDIVAAYHQRLCTFSISDYNREKCWPDYRFGVFHAAMITVFGAVASNRSQRGDRMFTVMAERSAAAIRDLDALSLL